MRPMVQAYLHSTQASLLLPQIHPHCPWPHRRHCPVCPCSGRHFGFRVARSPGTCCRGWSPDHPAHRQWPWHRGHSSQRAAPHLPITTPHSRPEPAHGARPRRGALTPVVHHNWRRLHALWVAELVLLVLTSLPACVGQSFAGPHGLLLPLPS
jgi:hypothetical protein